RGRAMTLDQAVEYALNQRRLLHDLPSSGRAARSRRDPGNELPRLFGQTRPLALSSRPDRNPLFADTSVTRIKQLGISRTNEVLNSFRRKLEDQSPFPQEREDFPGHPKPR